MQCEACDHENIDGARFCAKCGAGLPSPNTGDDPLIGQLVGGRYRITGVLGEGGMGIVYIGEQQMGSSVRKVAVKTLHAHLSKDPSVLARFHRECGTVAQLEHPNTIKFYDFGSMEDGTLYIAMEFVDGKPLADIIEETGAMQPERVLHIMKQVSGSLDEAHKQGIVHRDLKPDNIILGERAGEDDFVKLLDFGIAARSESADKEKEQKLTQQGMVLGTPPYMSPEQFTGKQLDRRSDIYSLGVMSYEMLTGRLPFEADTPWQWATEHMTAQPTPIEVVAPSLAVPDAMRAAVMRALAKAPEDRQATTREFYEELASKMAEAGLAPASVGAPPTDAAAAGPGTAAMTAVPDFNFDAGGSAPTGAMSAAPNPPGAPAGPYAPPPGGAYAVPPAPAPPPAPAAGGGGGSNTLLLAGLAGIGLLALAGIGVVVAMPRKKPPPPPLDSSLMQAGDDAGDGRAVKAVTPEHPTDGSPDPAPEPGPDPSPEPAGPSPSPRPGPGPTPSPRPGPAPAPAPRPTPSPTPQPKPAGNSAACDKCIAAARSGNVQGAAGFYRSCTDAGKKSQCAGFASRAGFGAARRAALNGNCSKAKAIIGAAAAMGKSINGAVTGTACQ